MNPPDLKSKRKIIMMGNPGSGKSTTQNLLAGECVFKSGPGDAMSGGSGVTQEWATWPSYESQRETFDKSPWILVDTPGLGDLTQAKRCSEKLTQALQHDGEYQLIFILRADGTRIQKDDATMMDSVTSSLGDQIKENQFSVVVNKIAAKEHKKLMADNEEAKAAHGNMIMNIRGAMLHCKTNKIFFNPEDKQLHNTDFEDLQDLMKPEDSSEPKVKMSEELRKFIIGSPAIVIEKEKVQKIKDMDEKMKAAREEEYAKCTKRNNELLAAKDAEHTNAIKKLQEDNAKLQEEASKNIQAAPRGFWDGLLDVVEKVVPVVGAVVGAVRGK